MQPFTPEYEQVRALAEAVRRVARSLEGPALRPQPTDRTRTVVLRGGHVLVADPAALAGALEPLLADLAPVLSGLALIQDVAGPQRAVGQRVVARTLSRLAGHLASLGRLQESAELLRAAASVDGPDADRLSLLARVPSLHGELCFAEHLIAEGEHAAADSRLYALRRRDMPKRIYDDVVCVWLDRPRSVAHPPLLFRWHTVGLGLFGHRDPQPDGSYFATQCVTALYLPLVPLTVFRLLDEPNGTQVFLTKHPLGPLAFLWRTLISASLLLLLVGACLWELVAGG